MAYDQFAADFASRPGFRRFHEILERERHDMGWLVHAVAALYDEVSGGAISIPTTYPSEVVAKFNERLTEARREALEEAVELIRKRRSHEPPQNAYDAGYDEAVADMAKLVTELI